MRDVDGKKILDEEGNTQTRITEYEKPVITNAWVFNAEQIKGIPPLAEYLKEKQGQQTWNPIERAEQLISDSKAVILHGGNEAYYNKASDQIRLPLKAQFENETKYYAVALHEIGHWTGHQSRLDRPMEGRFGSEAYAREELRAEIASLMLGSELKIGHNFGQHAAYVNNWIKILKEEPFELFRASADAQKIFDYMLDIGQKIALKEERPQNQTLKKGDEIAYNNNVYKVLDKKGKTFTVEDMEGGKTKVSPKDGLFKSLVQAKNNPAEQQLIEQEEEVSHSIGR